MPAPCRVGRVSAPLAATPCGRSRQRRAAPSCCACCGCAVGAWLLAVLAVSARRWRLLPAVEAASVVPPRPAAPAMAVFCHCPY